MIGDVAVGTAGAKGLGVFARRAFATGEFIFRRRHGRVVGPEAIASLSAEEQRHLCELGFEQYAVLLPPGCYLNHSCEPNAMRSGVKVFAMRAIAAGEEVTIDYRLNAFDDDSRWPCLCAAPSCTGEVTGSFFALPAGRQARYLPYAPSFIRAEWRRRQRSQGRPPEQPGAGDSLPGSG